MSNHNDFILSPITDILKIAVTATTGIGSGIETYPLCDYIMQSVFLKMTGVQEQKMKCICWELATNDYEYRRRLLAGEYKFGECSSYLDKNKVYKHLVAQIQNHSPASDFINDNDKQNILATAISDVKDIFLDTNLSIWAQNSFSEFTNNWTLIQRVHFANKDSLFENVLQDKYAVLYRHRNRCAHNTQSYQQNLPTLKTLAREDYKHENYFVWFSILVLIDKIFIELYEKYLSVLQDS